MVFGRGYRRTRLRSKPALMATNHCAITAFTTAAATTNQRAIFSGVEPPTNRSTHIPVGATLKGIDIQFWATDTTPVNGKHRCLMFYQQAATAFADPIAAWLDTADPLTEEAIQIRQSKMGRMEQYVTITGASLPPYWRCRWKGNIYIRDGDDVVVAIQDDNITNWEGICTAWWIA